MKKKYINPAIKMCLICNENPLLGGSGPGGGDAEDPTIESMPSGEDIDNPIISNQSKRASLFD
ncbi:MAG: hypothetical protein IJV27_12910 [Prevotella sp.]|nr:hypothetical protein [Prevotella sp.]